MGLNIPKPPDLLQLYRDFGNHQISAKDVLDIAVGTEEDELDATTPILESIPIFGTPQSIEVAKCDHFHLKCAAQNTVQQIMFFPVFSLA